MIATICEISTSCVRMTAELEATPAPPVGRLGLTVVVIAGLVITICALEWLRS